MDIFNVCHNVGRVLIILALVVATQLYVNDASAGRQLYTVPLSASKISAEKRQALAVELARIANVRAVSLSGLKFASNRSGRKQYVCGFFSYKRKKIPFSAEVKASNHAWDVVRDQQLRKELRKYGRRTQSSYFAAHAACAITHVYIGRWEKFVKSSPAKVSGGTFGMKAKERPVLEQGLLKSLRKKRVFSGKSVKVVSFASVKTKGTIRFGCGYAKVGKKTIPFSGFHVTKGKGSFIASISKKGFGTPAAFNATIESCKKEGLRMHSAL